MLATLGVAALLALAPSLGDHAPAPAHLVGTGIVDLRPTPDAPAYLQPFIVAAVDGDRIQGTFYGSPILESKVNTEWDDVRFAFVTSDGRARYVTVGRLLDGDLDGTTFSPDRTLLQPWRAVRAD